MIKALTLLIITGVCWNGVGVVVGILGRKGFSTTYYMIIAGIFNILAALLVALIAPEKALPPHGASDSAWLAVVGGCVACGACNYFMVQLMGIAMKKGPNAVVWATIQSGLIYPFLMGWLVFDVPMSVCRAAGITLIIASIVLYAARGKANGRLAVNKQENQFPLSAWFLPSVLGMLCCGLGQCGGNLPSYIGGGQEFPSAFRYLMCSIGSLSCCLVHILFRGLTGHWIRKPFPGEIRTIALYTFIAICISYPASAFLQYRGLDLLKNCGAGSMGYPTMVASCIISFFPYGLIVLHEKINPLQALGAVIGVAGIIIGCL